MGKMKELFMQKYQYGNLEREYLINDSLAKAWEEEEYEKLKAELNQPLTSKIEISDGKTTRVQIGEEKHSDNPEIEIPWNGF